LKLSHVLTPQKRYSLIKSKIKEFLPNDEIIVVSKTPYIRQYYPSKKLSHVTIVVVKQDNRDFYRINEQQLCEEFTSLSNNTINRISVRYGKSMSIQPKNPKNWDKYKLPDIFGSDC
jgi:hypothetical protein